MRPAILYLILSAARMAAQTVVGSVFDAATGAGIAGVKVELLRGTTGFYETLTDGGGRFFFDNVREEDYSVRYRSPDYWLTAGESNYKTFRVAAGNPVKLEARLMPWSKISGRVVDHRGNGVAKAPIELTGRGIVMGNRIFLRTSWGEGGGGQLGRELFEMTFRGTTDADGRFEVKLMPGPYWLSARPPPGLNPPESEDGRAMAWQRSTYPGVAIPEGASKILVMPGAEVSGVELRLLAVPTHAVRGMVANPDGTPAANVKVGLGARGTATQPDGTFEFLEAAEGEWYVTAEAQSGGVKLWAGEWIEVKRHNVENVKLRPVPPVTVRGKTVLEGKGEGPTARMPPLILGRRGRAQGGGDLRMPLGAVANPAANGNFTVEGVYPGAYQVSGPMGQQPPPPYYLDSVRAGEADLLTQEVEFSSADVAITVVYKTGGGAVRGAVENCAKGGVALVPQDGKLRRAGLSHSAPCDANDRYEIRGVRPGEYYALAFAGNGPAAAIDEAVLAGAVKVTVRSGEMSTADLRTVTRPIF